MKRGEWNHNVHYHDLLLAAVPAPCERALDIGCGQGEFARRLAERAARVVAIDRSAEMVARAKRSNADLPNAEIVQADFMEYPVEKDGFDFISAVAVLHHLPFRDALEKAKEGLRPGGVLAILGLYRMHAALDALWAVIAVPVNRVHLLAKGRTVYPPPIAPATMTLRQMRRSASHVLPGAKVRRHLFWRYSLIWQRP